MIKTSLCNRNPVPRNKYTNLYCLTKQVFKYVLYCLMTISEHCIGTPGILSRTIPATRTTTMMNMQRNRTHVYTEIESEPIGGFFPSMESVGVCGTGAYVLSIIARVFRRGNCVHALSNSIGQPASTYYRLIPNNLTAAFLAATVAK